MKTRFSFLSFILIGTLLIGCNGLVVIGKDVRTIHASDTFASEKRSVTGFNAIDIRTVGNVLLSQGVDESVTVQGSDNIVPLIKTSAKNGLLVIETDELLNIVGMQGKNILTFIIQAKDLSAVTVSGLAEVNVDRLSTPSLVMVMSGAGKVKMQGLATESLKLTVSGLGDMRIAGEATNATIVISGAGPVNAPDLKIQTADVTISGIGDATLWVTDRLTGTISGGGNVSYHGSPAVETNTTGLGNFVALDK